jgi:hypothetical protein
MTLKFVLLFIVCFGVSAQDIASIKADVAKTRYPPIAELARVQGDVVIDLGEEDKIVSGPAMLRQSALDNVIGLSAPNSVRQVVYHFQLAGPWYKTQYYEEKPEYDLLDRVFMKIIRKKSKKPIIHSYSTCDYSNLKFPEWEPLLSFDVKTLHVWKYGFVRCLNTQSSELVTSR